MASIETLLMLAKHPEWIPPRSDVRVFLGEPGAPEAVKTTVEPGNAFSPGMRSFGVTWWIRFPENGVLFAPEEAPLEDLRWSYEGGYLPILNCQAHAGGLEVRHTLFQDGTATARTEAVCGELRITNLLGSVVSVQVYVVLRSLGPAGGPLRDLAISDDGRTFARDNGALPLLEIDIKPDAFGCAVGDPSELARRGEMPDSHAAHDGDGWCFGVARFDLTLQPAEVWQFHFDCPLQTQGTLAREVPGLAVPRPAEFATRWQQHLALWRQRLGTITLDVPDDHFRNAFYAGLQHMLTAVVGDQVRIAPLAYPLPWLRDSVYILRCLDLAGLHELGRAGADYCARNDFFGGFGAEGDAPGQGIWALVEHYRLRKDRSWLEEIYPAIQRKCTWLYRMRLAAQPLQVFVDTPVLAFTHAERAAGVICVAARDGLIQGAMDHGVDYSLGWINQWAIAGLRAAAFAARELDRHEDAARYAAEADALFAALAKQFQRHPELLDLERTVNSVLWPTRVWEEATEHIASSFRTWWAANRGIGNDYEPEPYWLYFEFAQAHNAMLLGEREWAWRTVQHRLQHQDLPGLYGWREGGDGVGTENAIYGVTLINQLRGCQHLDSITPHGWSQAEFWLLQRAMLVEEWRDGLLLFAGIPSAWLVPGARVAIGNSPTWYGRVDARLSVGASGEEVRVGISGVVPGTHLWLRLPGSEIEGVAGSDGAAILLGTLQPK
jgi:hypothetical protein